MEKKSAIVMILYGECKNKTEEHWERSTTMQSEQLLVVSIFLARLIGLIITSIMVDDQSSRWCLHDRNRAENGFGRPVHRLTVVKRTRIQRWRITFWRWTFLTSNIGLLRSVPLLVPIVPYLPQRVNVTLSHTLSISTLSQIFVIGRYVSIHNYTVHKYA